MGHDTLLPPSKVNMWLSSGEEVGRRENTMTACNLGPIRLVEWHKVIDDSTPYKPHFFSSNSQGLMYIAGFDRYSGARLILCLTPKGEVRDPCCNMHRDEIVNRQDVACSNWQSSFAFRLQCWPKTPTFLFYKAPSSLSLDTKPSTSSTLPPPCLTGGSATGV